MEDKIQNLNNQVERLQQKIIELEENQTIQIKKALSELLKTSKDTKNIQQEYLKTNIGSYFQKNDGEAIYSIYQTKEVESKNVSEASKSPFNRVSSKSSK